MDVLSNKAQALKELYRFEEASEVYDRLQALEPDSAQHKFHRSALQLLTGQFEAGWEGFEARRAVSGHSIADAEFRKPIWLGREEIAGKTLLVYSDEGLGDAIQFARYLPLVSARGARVVFVAPDALYPLMSDLSDIQCRPPSAGLPPTFDLYCPVTSLPFAFGTALESIPPPVCLPSVPPNLIRAWEDAGSALTRGCGSAWSGRAIRNTRAITAAQCLSQFMARLLDVDGAFVSLQKDPRPDDKALLDEHTDIIDLSAGLTDFLQTAALDILPDGSSQWTPALLIWPRPLDVRRGYCCHTSRTGAGCLAVTTVPGTRPCDCSGRRQPANMQVWCNAFATNCSPKFQGSKWQSETRLPGQICSRNTKWASPGLS